MAIRITSLFSKSRGDRANFWKTLSGGSRTVFFVAVFFTFSCLGFLNVLTTPTHQPMWEMTVGVLGSGIFAIFYAWAGVLRKYWLLVAIWIAQFGLFALVGIYGGEHARLLESHSEAQQQLFWLSLGAKVTLVAGYVLFLVFFGREGGRYFKAHAEIQLAQEIHRALVPTIERSIGNFSMYGASLPSGEVGGDLVDVVEGGSWTAYVADVSGHGVSAGVLMAMFKTAVRTTVLADGAPNALLNEVHRALYPLKTANLFVTAGVLHCDGAGKLTLSMAGHPPLLHFCKATGSVSEVAAQDLPLGILPEQSFVTCEIAAAPGDLLVLLTDGLTEVFDGKQNEMGIEPVKTALRENAGRPLPELFATMRQVALKFGKQDDDQTMLLVRMN